MVPVGQRLLHPALLHLPGCVQVAEGQVLPTHGLLSPRKSRQDSILTANTISRMESTANGMTFFGSVASLVFFMAFICLGLLVRKVGLSPPPPSSGTLTVRTRNSALAVRERTAS